MTEHRLPPSTALYVWGWSHCGIAPSLDAFSDEGKAELARCRGRWPHLRTCAEEPCQAAQRAILLGASNSWFPMTLSALSIPSTTDKLGQLIVQNWAELEEYECAREVKLMTRCVPSVIPTGIA
jgi:hypothetical protein